MSVCGTMHKVIYELQSEADFIWEHWNNYKLDRQKATQNWKLHTYSGDQRQSLSLYISSIKTGSLTMNCRKKKERIAKNICTPGLLKRVNAIILISMHRLMQGTFFSFVCCCFSTQKESFFSLLSFIQAVHSIALVTLPESTGISLAFSHTDAMLVHGLSLKARLSFIGHEVHCFNFSQFTSLRWRGKHCWNAVRWRGSHC